MMEYKGYIGQVELDDEAGVFFGKVVNLSKDGITFQGSTVEELRSAFRDSVDDYLSWCAETACEPEKPYSGKFVVRVAPADHGKAAFGIQHRKRYEAFCKVVCNSSPMV
jgi:predicted HicB family RNase H-like nuclease